MAENIWEIDNQRLLFNHNIVLYDAKFIKECTSRASGAFISLFRSVYKELHADRETGC